jgi:hypothetical protein
MNKGDKKLHKKLNVIDIVIGIILIALVVFALNKLGIIGVKDIVVNEESKIEIIFFQEEVNAFTAENVKIGDPASESLLNASFGNVTEKSVGPSISYGKDKFGRQTTSTKEGYSSIYITLTANGKVGDNGVVIEGSTYYIGQIINLKVGSSIFYGRIDAVNQL